MSKDEMNWTAEEESDEDAYEPTLSPFSWDGRYRRVNSEQGFRFLTPPQWFKFLHLFKTEGKRQAVWTRLAYIAYWLSRDPSKSIYKDSRKMRLAVRSYPLYFLMEGTRTQLRRLRGIAILLAILGIPFILGFLVGSMHHISISIH